MPPRIASPALIRGRLDYIAIALYATEEQSARHVIAGRFVIRRILL